MKKYHVDKLLEKVLFLLTERGFKTVSTVCETYRPNRRKKADKTSIIQIEFDNYYPLEVFAELSPEWMVYEYRIAGEGTISSEVYSGISYSEQHPPNESGEEIVEFAKFIALTNLESWLVSMDPQAFKAVITFMV